MKSGFSGEILKQLEWPALLERIKPLCYSDASRNRFSSLPLLSADESLAQMKKISEIKLAVSMGRRPDFAGLSDICEAVQRAARDAVLNMEELISVRNFLGACASLRSFFGEDENFSLMKSEASGIEVPVKLKNTLDGSFTVAGDLSRAEYPAIRSLQDSINAARSDAEKTANRIINSREMEKALQERIFTTISQRYLILVKSGMKNSVRGTVMDISSSGATLYIEPDELRPFNNKIISLEIELQSQIYRILKDLSEQTAVHADVLLANFRILAFLDFLNAAAAFSVLARGSEPVIARRPCMKLCGLRHPLLHIMDPDGTVANEFELGFDFSSLIISGANTGGKSVLLKAVGLAAYFAAAGLHISAGPESEIGIFREILADIGDEQNIQQSLSTFSAELVSINEILGRAGEGTLVLLDEIITGTNPSQGAAIARAVLEALASSGALVMATSHYSELKELASGDARFMNASVSFDPASLRPTYRLRTGIPGSSYALEIAGNYGLPRSIIERAAALLDSAENEFESLVNQVQKYRENLEAERKKLDELRQKFAEEKIKYSRKMRKLNKLEEDLKMEKGISFIDELGRQRDRISARISELQNLSSKEAAGVQREIKEARDTVVRKIAEQKRAAFYEGYAEFSPPEASPGDRVFVVPLEREAVIEEIDPEGKTALMLFGGSIRARFKFRDLLVKASSSDRAVIIDKPRPVTETPAVEHRPVPLTLQTSYNTIDLRGMTGDEAMIFMEQKLDRMSRENTGAAVIIHGHGTGVLKRLIRANLPFSAYVDSFRTGGDGEGGDGVTIALLK